MQTFSRARPYVDLNDRGCEWRVANDRSNLEFGIHFSRTVRIIDNVERFKNTAIAFQSLVFILCLKDCH